MSSVGLLYVGAVLLINGLMLLGKIPGKSAAPINLFVGAMQVIFPTIIILQAGGDSQVILATSGQYLFGFTYLYVAWNELTGATSEGLGWFSLYVAACAVVYGVLQFTVFADPVFGVIWLAWAALWYALFLLMAQNRTELQRRIGWLNLFLAFTTCALPAFLQLSGLYQTGPVQALVALTIAAILFTAAWTLGSPKRLVLAPPVAVSPPTEPIQLVSA